MADDLKEELQVTIWPLKLSAKGKHAVEAVKEPLALILLAFALALLVLAVTSPMLRPSTWFKTAFEQQTVNPRPP